jgi:hypothetical protein
MRRRRDATVLPIGNIEVRRIKNLLYLHQNGCYGWHSIVYIVDSVVGRTLPSCRVLPLPGMCQAAAGCPGAELGRTHTVPENKYKISRH